MRILLTGASGFVGKALLPELIGRGHHVTLLSRKPTGTRLPEIIADTTSWATAVKGYRFDLCLHLAWIATPGIYLESPENEILATSTIDLADTLFRSGLPHFLALGSCIEYAPRQTAPSSESGTPIAPQSTYGKAKEKARTGIATAAALHGQDYTWVRLFYPYGNGEHTNRIPSTFLRTLSSGQPLSLKTPASVKDWIEIRDVTGALVHLSEIAAAQQEINLGTGIGTSIIELARISQEATGTQPDLIQANGTIGTDPYPFHVADITKISRSGWKPSISPRDGIDYLFSKHK